jgi:hypothetical protein
MADWQSEQRAGGQCHAAGNKFAAAKIVAANDAMLRMRCGTTQRLGNQPSFGKRHAGFAKVLASFAY